MVDFTSLPTRKKAYAGANGSKISVMYDGRQYMLKFATPYISDLQKEFYKTMLAQRKERILDYSLERLQAQRHRQ